MNQALSVWLILSLIWGTTWIFIKLGLRDLPPLTFAGLRFLLAASILWLIVLWRRREVPRRPGDWLLIAFTGFIAFAVNYGLIFWGEQYINSGLAAVLQSTIPAFGLVYAHYLLPAERITTRKLAGVFLGIAGTSVIFYDQMKVEGAHALWGSLALLGSSVFMAYSNVLVKARCRHLDPATLAAGQMIFGFVPLLVLGALWEGSPFDLPWTRQSVVALLYLALIGSSIAFLLYYWLLKHIAVTKTMLISLVTPVIALLIGMLTLSEHVSWRILLGSAGILVGISLIVIERGGFKGKEIAVFHNR
ncbi:MAG: EamA family transporter [Blastocatellia bacterium]|nr:EamA family transporter [Blastocatellia bacterium]